MDSIPINNIPTMSNNYSYDTWISIHENELFEIFQIIRESNSKFLDKCDYNVFKKFTYDKSDKSRSKRINYLSQMEN